MVFLDSTILEILTLGLSNLTLKALLDFHKKVFQNDLELLIDIYVFNSGV